MKRHILAAASVAALTSASIAEADTDTINGFEVTRNYEWLKGREEVELARFPLDASRPTFKVMLRAFPPMSDECANMDACTYHCAITIEVDRRKLPWLTVPTNGFEQGTNGEPVPDFESITVAGINDLLLIEEGHTWNTSEGQPVLHASRSGEGIRINAASVLLAPKDCFGGIRSTYHKNWKRFYQLEVPE